MHPVRLEAAATVTSPMAKVRETLRCWWVLLRAKLSRRAPPDPEVTNCLQLKRGTRFRLSGGRVELLDEDGAPHELRRGNSAGVGSHRAATPM